MSRGEGECSEPELNGQLPFWGTEGTADMEVRYKGNKRR